MIGLPQRTLGGLPCTPLEREPVFAQLHEERFVDRAPASIYTMSLEEKTDPVLDSHAYRALEPKHETRERRAQRRHPGQTPPQPQATTPN